MAYKVIGAAAVVELDDGKPELNTGSKVYLEEDGILPDGVKQACIDHLVAVGLIAAVEGSAHEAKSARKTAAARASD